MSLRPLSLRNIDSPVRTAAPTQSIAAGEPSPTQQPQIGWSRFRDIFTGGKPQRAGLPTSPQTEPNGRPQKKNIADFLGRLKDLFGSGFTKGLSRVWKMLSMSTTKPMLPPPNTLSGGL